MINVEKGLVCVFDDLLAKLVILLEAKQLLFKLLSVLAFELLIKPSVHLVDDLSNSAPIGGLAISFPGLSQ